VPGERVVPEDKNGRGEPHQGGQGKQQRDPAEQRKREAEPPGAGAAALIEVLHQNGDKDDIVDAEDDFERRQADQRGPGIEAGDEVPHRPA
jgi:hypothetical protein